MNNQTRYQTRQAAYAAAQEELAKWANPRAYAHISNACTILRKRNQGKSTEEQIIPKGYEWAAPSARGHKIIGYSADAIQIAYTTGPWNKRETKTFEMPISDLSLSTWAYNKRLRDAFKAAKAEKALETQRAYADKIAQAAREAKEAEKKLEALRAERDQFKAKLADERTRGEAKAAKRAAAAQARAEEKPEVKR